MYFCIVLVNMDSYELQSAIVCKHTPSSSLGASICENCYKVSYGGMPLTAEILSSMEIDEIFYNYRYTDGIFEYTLMHEMIEKNESSDQSNAKEKATDSFNVYFLRTTLHNIPKKINNMREPTIFYTIAKVLNGIISVTFTRVRNYRYSSMVICYNNTNGGTNNLRSSEISAVILSPIRSL